MPGAVSVTNRLVSLSSLGALGQNSTAQSGVEGMKLVGIRVASIDLGTGGTSVEAIVQFNITGAVYKSLLRLQDPQDANDIPFFTTTKSLTTTGYFSAAPSVSGGLSVFTMPPNQWRVRATSDASNDAALTLDLYFAREL